MREISGKMKILLSCFVVIILVSLIFLSSGYFDEDDYAGYITVNSVSDLARNSNRFAFDMYDQLNTDSNNVFFSPYSLTTALGMAYEGARGQTAIEMGEVLNLPEDNQTRWDLIRAFQSEFNQPSDYYTLTTANAYWPVSSADISSVYQEIIEQYYLAHGEELDFIGNPTGSANKINDWVEEETNGKIQDLISPSMISPLTYLILTNAIYFKSDWKYQFRTNSTREGTFYLSNNSEIETQMMHMNDENIELNYAENNDVQMLQLPYKGDELSMYIMLPKYDSNITTLENNLNYKYYNSLKEDMSEKWVEIIMPKYEISRTYNLGPSLIELGMPTAFSPGANFTGISESEPLYIDRVTQKSFIEVNEEGTEAAAATAVVIVRYGEQDPNHRYFHANHPFIFFIEHEETGQILFMGKLENPEI